MPRYTFLIAGGIAWALGVLLAGSPTVGAAFALAGGACFVAAAWVERGRRSWQEPPRT